MTVEIETRGLDAAIARVSRMPGDVDAAARLAVNDSARMAVRLGSKQILDEINYPRSYLRGEKSRLAVSKYAQGGDLEAEVRGRDRPTSLARFAQGAVRFGRNVSVRVKVATGGATKKINRGFFMKLRRGASFDGENANVGLAVRVGKGESLRHSTAAQDLGNGLFLLYGPSVDQAFQGVAHDIVPRVSDNLESEFLRQFERLSNG
jgi:hypothetical protein